MYFIIITFSGDLDGSAVFWELVNTAYSKFEIFSIRVKIRFGINTPKFIDCNMLRSKPYISRKSIVELGHRQRKITEKRIRSILHRNCNVAICNQIPTPASTTASENSEVVNLLSQNVEECSDSNFDFDTANISFAESNLSVKENNCTVPEPDNCDKKRDTISDKVDFSDALASVYADTNVNHVQGDAILKVLRTHKCLSFLPKTTRTLLGTPRIPSKLRDVSPGQYLHVGFENAVIATLSTTEVDLIPRELEIDFSTDGALGDNEGKWDIWPIQSRIANIRGAKAELLGIYRGKTKPACPVSFFEDFVEEVKVLREKGGIEFNGKIIPFRFRAFIADAPARAFVLRHAYPTSYHACSKCHIVAERFAEHRNLAFVSTSNEPRTHNEYLMRDLEDMHFKDGETPLIHLLDDIVAQTPFEIMHLAYIGCEKKILQAWVDGKFSKKTKLSWPQIRTVNERLEVLATYCPVEFSRPPEPVSVFNKYKATVHRQMLKYTGIVVFKGIVIPEAYEHYLLFHSAIRCLSRADSPSETDFTFADLALKAFVDLCSQMYGTSFLSYNTHGLLHIVEDAKRFGNIDSYSAFEFENNMGYYRECIRKPSDSLQQIARRRVEKKKIIPKTMLLDHRKQQVLHLHTDGPVPECFKNCSQYKSIDISRFRFTTNRRNNCCILKDGTIHVIRNVLLINDSFHFVTNEFQSIQDFYDVGLPSSHFGVFECKNLSSAHKVFPISEVNSKCFRMPHWTDRTSDWDSSDEHEYCSSFIVAILD